MQHCFLVANAFLLVERGDAVVTTASCDLLEIDVGKAKTFEKFRKEFQEETFYPVRLRGVTEKWDAKKWGFDDLIEKLGDIKVWPKDMRFVDHTGAAKHASQTIRQFLTGPPTENAVFEVNFNPLSHAMIKAHSVPKVFQKNIYALPVVGLSRNGTGTGFHRADVSGTWGTWIAQVHGSTTWALYPPDTDVKEGSPNMWPWPLEKIKGNDKPNTCTLTKGDAIFIPGHFSRAWYGEGDANLHFGWRGPEKPPDAIQSLFSAVSANDVDGFKTALKSVPDESRAGILSSCVNHAMQVGHLPILKQLHIAGALFDEEDPSGSTHMHAACQAGQVESVKYGLARGAELSVKRGRDGMYPIHVAIFPGHAEVTEHLLTKGKAKWSVKTGQGLQPLHLAAMQGHSALIEVLIANRAQHNAQSKDGLKPLHLASEHNRAPAIEVLLKLRAALLGTDKKGEAALHRAVTAGHENIVELLIQRRTSIELQTKGGQRPAHYATFTGQLSMLKFLHAHGAEMSPNTTEGQYSLDGLAASSGHSAMIDFLRSASKPTISGAPVHAALQAGHLPMLKKVLEKHIQVGPPEMHQMEMVMSASSFGHKKILEYLIKEYGSKLMAIPQADFRNSLHIAAKAGHANAIKQLVQARVEVDFKDSSNSTALLVATSQGHKAAVNELINLRADTDHHNSQQMSALHIAMLGSKKDIADVLLKRGAGVKVDELGEGGRKHLHAASAIGHTSLVKVLLDNRADIHSPDSSGFVPVMLAAQHGHLSTVKLLADRRADVLKNYQVTVHRNETEKKEEEEAKEKEDPMAMRMDEAAKAAEAAAGVKEDAPFETNAMNVAGIAGHIPLIKFFLAEADLDRTEMVANKLGEVHGKDFKEKLEKELALEERIQQANKLKDHLKSPENARKLDEFNKWYAALKPEQRKVVDAKIQEQSEIEGAKFEQKQRDLMNRVTKPEL